MNDLKDLFELALGDGHGPGPDQLVDPAGDLTRGRRRLRRRHGASAAGLAGLLAIGAVGGVPLLLGGSATGSDQAGQQGRVSKAGRTAVTSQPGRASVEASGAHGFGPIALIAYSGDQPSGYEVQEIPAGWEIQGGTPMALTIAPKGFPDQERDSYVGKLVVMLHSQDAPPPTEGTSQPVEGRPGRLRVEGDTQVLIYQGVDGRWVDIQAPTSLGWSGSQIAQFGAGVTVLGTAQPGRG